MRNETNSIDLGASLDVGPLNEISAPKLSLFFLLAGMTSFAILLGVQESVESPIGVPNPTNPFWKWTFRAVRIISGVFCITGATIVVREWRLTNRFSPLPGYLLLLCAGGFFLLNLAIDYFIGYRIDEFRNSDFSIVEGMQWMRKIWIFQTSLNIGLAGVALFGVFRYRWWWRVGFACFAISALLMATSIAVRGYYMFQVNDLETYQKIGNYSQLAEGSLFASILVFAGCLLFDLISNSKSNRNWLHWCGPVSLLLIYLVPKIVLIVACRYLSPSELFGI